MGWSVAIKQRVATITGRIRMVWKWFVRLPAPPQLLLFEDKLLKLFNWSDLQEVASAEIPVLQALFARRGSMSCGFSDVDAISISNKSDGLILMKRSALTHKYLRSCCFSHLLSPRLMFLTCSVGLVPSYQHILCLAWTLQIPSYRRHLSHDRALTLSQSHPPPQLNDQCSS